MEIIDYDEERIVRWLTWLNTAFEFLGRHAGELITGVL